MQRIGKTNYWPLWTCLPVESLVALCKYQWDKYGLRLDLITSKDMYQLDLEPIEEIDKLMRQKPKTRARG